MSGKLRTAHAFSSLLSAGFVFLPAINGKNIQSGESGIKKSSLSPSFLRLECFKQIVRIKLSLLASPSS